MISVPNTIQTQLGEAISVIADSDFWERWDTLVDDLVSRFTPDNPKVNNGVLQVAHSIFRRWRPLFRTDDLFTEINHVLSKFCEPYLALLQVRLLCTFDSYQRTLTLFAEHRSANRRKPEQQGAPHPVLHHTQPQHQAVQRPFLPRSASGLRRQPCLHQCSAHEVPELRQPSPPHRRRV